MMKGIISDNKKKPINQSQSDSSDWIMIIFSTSLSLISICVYGPHMILFIYMVFFCHLVRRRHRRRLWFVYVFAKNVCSLVHQPVYSSKSMGSKTFNFLYKNGCVSMDKSFTSFFSWSQDKHFVSFERKIKVSIFQNGEKHSCTCLIRDSTRSDPKYRQKLIDFAFVLVFINIVWFTIESRISK